MNETVQAQDASSGLRYRLRPAANDTDPTYILLHGLTGDEDAMWVLESALPGEGLVAAPRGLHRYRGNGYSWVEPSEVDRLSVTALHSGAQVVERWLDALQQSDGLRPERTVLVGFSQGAGLAFALAERGHLQPAAVVVLAGFLPSGEYEQLADLNVFWGHGTADETVPIARARDDVERLRSLGAQVHFCEADVGHKVGVECMRGLEGWLADCLPQAGEAVGGAGPSS